MNQSEQINEIATALAKAQGEILPAAKDGTNPHFKSRYADLASISNACRPALSRHGIAATQTMEEQNGKLVLHTTIIHSSGQWIRSTLPILSAKQDAQSIGSALTYMRRYGLAAIVGVVADDDDDGERAMPRNNRSDKPQEESPPVVSRAQAYELGQIIDECDQVYKSQLWASLQKPPFSISSLDQMPLALYDRVKTAAIKKRDEHKTSKVEELEVAHA